MAKKKKDNKKKEKEQGDEKKSSKGASSSDKKKSKAKDSKKNKVEKKEEDKKKDGQNIPKVRPGYIVKVTHLSPDGERDFVTKGVVLRVRGSGQNKTFTLRSEVAGVGMEKVFNLHSPALKSVKVDKKLKTRKARLYHLRDQEAKESKKATSAN